MIVIIPKCVSKFPVTFAQNLLSVQKLENAVGGHQHFQGSSGGFVIHHYAGKVSY